MSLIVIAALGFGVLIAILLFQVFHYRKISEFCQKGIDLAPVIRGIDDVWQRQEQVDRSVRDEMSRGRQEQSGQSQLLRGEVVTVLTGIGDSVSTKLDSLTRSNDQKLELVRSAMEQRLDSFTTQSGSKLQELRATVDGRLATIQVENEKKLEQMRQTVDEKLQGTLEARLGESFKQVSDRLEQVYKGLGEMQSLAVGVGDLKKVLTNVKARGTWGEVQLGALLEQMLAREQYEHNVATSGTAERVEYAIKFPGADNNSGPLWLPIDAKFPIEDYLRLVDASANADREAEEKASRQLEIAIKSCAKSISGKYVAPPFTTDFAILFLSTEGLYAEAVRRPGLAESIQREFRVVLAGPSTLCALLNSLQMGFRTLAIQKRSSEVWELLGIVKAEFEKYSGVLAKVKKKLSEAQNTVDRAETRTRAIQRKLRDVEVCDSPYLIEGEPLFERETEESEALVGAG